MVRLWAIFLVMCAFIMRVSEITLFCPTFEHVRLPTDPRDWNDLGLPEFIELGLVQWKGRTNRSVYWMKLSSRGFLSARARNRYDLVIRFYKIKCTQLRSASSLLLLRSELGALV